MPTASRITAVSGATVLSAALVLGLAACSDDSDPKSAASGQATTKPGARDDRQRLVDAALAKPELPAGYGEIKTPLSDGEPTTTPATDEPAATLSDPRCAPLEASDQLPPVRERVERNYKGTEEDQPSTPTVLTGLTLHDPADITRFLTSVDEAIVACGTYSAQQPKHTMNWTVERVPVPAVGDRAVGYRRVTTDGDLGGSSGVLVYVQVGDVLMSMLTLELGDDTAAAPPDALVKAQADKVRTTA